MIKNPGIINMICKMAQKKRSHSVKLKSLWPNPYKRIAFIKVKAKSCKAKIVNENFPIKAKNRKTGKALKKNKTNKLPKIPFTVKKNSFP